jgi:hypothetical protein
VGRAVTSCLVSSWGSQSTSVPLFPLSAPSGACVNPTCTFSGLGYTGDPCKGPRRSRVSWSLIPIPTALTTGWVSSLATLYFLRKRPGRGLPGSHPGSSGPPCLPLHQGLHLLKAEEWDTRLVQEGGPPERGWKGSSCTPQSDTAPHLPLQQGLGSQPGLEQSKLLHSQLCAEPSCPQQEKSPALLGQVGLTDHRVPSYHPGLAALSLAGCCLQPQRFCGGCSSVLWFRTHGRGTQREISALV